MPSPKRSRPWKALATLFCINLLFAGVAMLAFARPPAAVAQNGLSADDQAILDEVRARTARPDDLAVQQAPDGSWFVNADGALQAVLLAVTTPEGEVVARCVTTLEEAAAVLAGTDDALLAAVPFSNDGEQIRARVESDPALLAYALAATETVITIRNSDAAGEGFNDPAAAPPVAGNTGATVGQQRLKAFEYAAGIWAAYLQSTVPIEIQATFDPLPCSTTGAVLGSAGPQSVHSDFVGTGGFFPGAENANTWYPQALANKRTGGDLSPAVGDIVARFNSEIGKPGCLPSNGWYYGFDGNEGSKIDLVTTLLHEFGHGLGFLSLVSVGGSGQPPLGSNFNGRNDIWNYYLTGKVGGVDKLWKDMTTGERASSISSGNLVWGGPLVTNAASFLTAGRDAQGRVRMYAPGTVQPGSSVSHYDVSTAPNLLMEPSINADLGQQLDLTDELMRDIGWFPDESYNGLDDRRELNLSLAQSAASLQARAGQAVTLTLTARNQGFATTAATLSDSFSAQLSGVNWTASYTGGASGPASGTGNLNAALTLPGGSSAVFTVRATIAASATSGTQIVNQAALTRPSGGQLVDLSGTSDDSASVTLNVLSAQLEFNLSVISSASPSVLQAGKPVTLTLVVSNKGFDTSAITLTNNFVAQLASPTWSIVYAGGASGPASGSGNINAALSLPGNSSATITVRATVNAVSNTQITNTAQITRPTGAPGIDLSGTADDTSVLTLTVSDKIYLLHLPFLRR